MTKLRCLPVQAAITDGLGDNGRRDCVGLFDIGIDDKCFGFYLPPWLAVDVGGGYEQYHNSDNAEEQWMRVWALVVLAVGSAAEATDVTIPSSMVCTAVQTAGFHDFPHNEEAYEPVSFFESSFELRINRVLMRHRDPNVAVDLYVPLVDEDERAELECRTVRGAGAADGLSCSNLPPSELLLLNTASLRFTRTSIGGWTFASATENMAGDSIYVEYGTCAPK